MKTMTCQQLGGACDKEFRGQTFEDLAMMSQGHTMKMVQQADQPHLDAMEQMKEIMKDPDAMQNWMAEKKKEFDALPES
jgi:hypothetical protein